jgi:hypothetical protein
MKKCYWEFQFLKLHGLEMQFAVTRNNEIAKNRSKLNLKKIYAK